MPTFVESFEGIVEGPNSPQLGTPAFVYLGAPGSNEAFVFESGLRLDLPLPNDPLGLGAFSTDFARGRGEINLFENGTITSANEVPDGSGFVVWGNFADRGDPSFSFPEPTFTVSALITTARADPAAPQPSVTMIAFDAYSNVIDSVTIAAVHAKEWHDNRVSITSGVPIARVTFTSDDFEGGGVRIRALVMDELAFGTDVRKITGTSGRDLIGAKDASSGQLVPGDLGEAIYGKGGKDEIHALGGPDLLAGGKGKDQLFGGDGNDTMTGGKGKDVLTGGEGRDYFLFRDQLATGRDKIKDFAPDEDTILLSRNVFSTLNQGALPASEFRSGGRTDQDDRILYKDGKLYYDPDGRGGEEAVQFARLAGKPVITEQDFLVVA